MAHVILKSNQDFFRIQNGSIKYPKGTFLLLDTLGLFTFECFHLKWWKFAFNWAQVPPRYIFQIHHFYPSYPILWNLLTLWSPKWWCNIFFKFCIILINRRTWPAQFKSSKKKFPLLTIEWKSLEKQQFKLKKLQKINYR